MGASFTRQILSSSSSNLPNLAAEQAAMELLVVLQRQLECLTSILGSLLLVDAPPSAPALLGHDARLLFDGGEPELEPGQLEQQLLHALEHTHGERAVRVLDKLSSKTDSRSRGGRPPARKVCKGARKAP